MPLAPLLLAPPLLAPLPKAALAAVREVAPKAICDGVDTLYNEHPYDGRGW